MSPLVIVVFAVLLRIFLNPLVNVFQKQLILNRHPPLLLNFITYLILSVISIVFIFEVDWHVFPAEFWVYAGLVGLLGALGDWFYISALESGDLSVIGPLNAYKSIIGIIFGIIILHEIPNMYGVMGIAMIIYGSYYVLDTKGEKFSTAIFFRKEIQFRIWGMVLAAIEAVFIKKIIEYSSFTIAFVILSCSGTFFCLVLLLLNLSKVKKTGTSYIGRRDITRYLYVALFIAAIQFGTNYIYQYIDVGYALSLFQLSAIASVLLGHKIFQEKEIRKKLIGSFFMLLGSVVIILWG
ncbi:EamA family transporter [Rubrolithibacter danxiaensis]|uniref:EamA family transporter n=1 Tax=Rubrolithibacter danxiaensis TaxID=3390805 RepID=UPI003BF81DAA